MTRLLRLLIVVSAFAVAMHAEEIKGILMDTMCSGKADLRISGATGTLVGGRIVAEAHTRLLHLRGIPGPFDRQSVGSVQATGHVVRLGILIGHLESQHEVVITESKGIKEIRWGSGPSVSM